MLTQIRIALPVSFETATASSQVRCQWTRQGFFQSSAVGAGHIDSRVEPCGIAAGEPCLVASGEGAPPPPWAWARPPSRVSISVRMGADMATYHGSPAHPTLLLSAA